MLSQMVYKAQERQTIAASGDESITVEWLPSSMLVLGCLRWPHCGPHFLLLTANTAQREKKHKI